MVVVCVLQIIPDSVSCVFNRHDDGGGNKVTEPQIKLYLRAALGDAPQPEWGLPENSKHCGWGGYLAGEGEGGGGGDREGK